MTAPVPVPVLISSDRRDLPADKLVFVIDIQNYSKAGDADLPMLRGQLDAVLGTVFERSGLGEEWRDTSEVKDAGDGCIVLLPTRRAAWVLDPLIGGINEALRLVEARRLASAPELRVRVAVHLGPVPDSHRCQAVNDACRFVDSDAVRNGLKVAAEMGSYTALIISDEVHRRIVAALRTTSPGPRDFLEVPATIDKKSFHRNAWLHVPGVDPATLAARLPTSGPAPAEPAPPQVAAAPRAGTRIKVKNAGQVIGDLQHATVTQHNH